MKIIKKILLGLLIAILSMLLVLTIWNQVECYKNEEKVEQIKNLVMIKNKNINVYETGKGNKTIIILSGMGIYSPIVEYKPLAEKLGKDYRVVIIEYLGYGFSDDTKEERSSINIVEEVRETMKTLEIEPPYILMPHSISGIYSLQYTLLYPNEVEAVIGIDSSVPNQTKYVEEESISAALPLIGKFFDLTGITRISMNASNPYFKDMLKGGYYSESDILLEREAASRNTASNAVVNERNCFVENTKNLYDVKYPENMPVLNIISEESCEKYSKYMNELNQDITWEELHKNMYSNDKIQKNVMLRGSHYLYWTQTDEISRQTKEFLNERLKLKI